MTYHRGVKETRRTYRRRRFVASGISLIAAGGAAVGVYVPVVLLAPLPQAVVTTTPWTEPARPSQVLTLPTIGASALGAVGFDGLLAQSGISTPVPIASISKVITALVVLEAKPITASEAGPTLTFTAADAALSSKYTKMLGKVEPMRAGEQLTERQALEVMLVSSANNYAEAIADWAFGDESSYVDATHAWLNEHDLTATTIVEPTGISPQNVSSPANLVRLGELALQHPVVAAIVSARQVTVPVLGTVNNTNELLGIGGVDGIKTGTLPEAGSCLLFSADYPVGDTTVTVVGVILGGTDRDAVDAAVTALLAGVATGFHQVKLAAAGEKFAAFSTPWGESANATAAKDARAIVWSDRPITSNIETLPMAVGSLGERAGILRFRVNEQSVTVPLRLDSPISSPDAWWRITHPDAIFPR